MKWPNSMPDFLRRIPIGELPERLTDRLPGRGEPVILELDLSRGVAESPPSNPLAALRGMRTPQLRVLVDHLRRAGEDDEVLALIGLFGGPALTLAQSGELRAAVTAFRASGRPTLAWADSFGELGPDMTHYHLATAFEQVWLQPSGGLGLVGFAAEGLFLREALDKAGVQPQISHRHEYKSAAEMFNRSEMSPENREMLTRMLASATEVLTGDVAAARELTPDAVRQLMDVAPLTAEQARQAGLVDELGYRDQAYAALRERAGVGAKPGDGPDDGPKSRYVERHGGGRLEALREQVQGVAAKASGGRPQVAVVHAAGGIVTGRGDANPLDGNVVGAITLGAVLRAAGRSEQVKAVVLRVDSPGGSYVASDSVRREVLALREAGTPVVASMASVAASGGYFISMGCDRIVANPGTITGSIGVLAGKAVVRDALARFGVRRDTVASTPRAAMFSTNAPFDDQQQAALEKWLDDVYADFTTKAAGDRGMSVEAVHEVARGRVWTGADAHERGLVDVLGGLDVAIDEACALAGLNRDGVDVRTLPRSNPFSALMPADNSDSVEASAGALPGGVFSGVLSRAALSVVPAQAARSGVLSGGALPGALSQGVLAALIDEGPMLWRRFATAGVLSLPPISVPGLLTP